MKYLVGNWYNVYNIGKRNVCKFWKKELSGYEFLMCNIGIIKRVLGAFAYERSD